MAVSLTSADGAYDAALEQLESDLLLEALHRRYAYDFRGYAPASLRRRLWRRAALEGVGTLSELTARLLHDPACVERLLADLSISVTEMFRDPGFHRALSERAFGHLRTYPYLRAWVAGCSTGEEVVSLAISLCEAGLLERTRIYATDMNDAVLARAREASFALERIRDYTRNYLQAGGTREFSSYYEVRGRSAVFDRSLLGGVVFAQHNLATDGSFNEFHLILCRNVMIYLGKPLQDRVLELFDSSLVSFGVLGLGRKETLAGTGVEDRYETLDAAEQLHRRRGV